MPVEAAIQVLDGDADFFQKVQPVVAFGVVARIHAVNGDRVVRPVHPPGHRRQMVYVIKVPDEKEEHSKNRFVSLND